MAQRGEALLICQSGNISLESKHCPTFHTRQWSPHKWWKISALLKLFMIFSSLWHSQHVPALSFRSGRSLQIVFVLLPLSSLRKYSRLLIWSIRLQIRIYYCFIASASSRLAFGADHSSLLTGRSTCGMLMMPLKAQSPSNLIRYLQTSRLAPRNGNVSRYTQCQRYWAKLTVQRFKSPKKRMFAERDPL